MTFAPLLLAHKKPQPNPFPGGVENNACHKNPPTFGKVGGIETYPSVTNSEVRTR
jgi:hypothetical protein